MLELLFIIFSTFYVLLSYAFLAPALIGFWAERHTGSQKVLQVFAFAITPLALPFIITGILMIAMMMIVFMVVAYPLYWMKMHFPFGGVLKAWYRISSRLLDFTRELLETLLALVSVHPQPESSTAPIPFQIKSGSN